MLFKLGEVTKLAEFSQFTFRLPGEEKRVLTTKKKIGGISDPGSSSSKWRTKEKEQKIP